MGASGGPIVGIFFLGATFPQANWIVSTQSYSLYTKMHLYHYLCNGLYILLLLWLLKSQQVHVFWYNYVSLGCILRRRFRNGYQHVGCCRNSFVRQKVTYLTARIDWRMSENHFQQLTCYRISFDEQYIAFILFIGEELYGADLYSTINGFSRTNHLSLVRKPKHF